MPLTRPSRSVRLLELLLALRCFTEEELAAELVIDVETLADYRAGRVRMPLERQLCLALIAVEKAPRFERLGRELRLQVGAAIAYETHVTETHDAPPVQARRVSMQGRH